MSKDETLHINGAEVAAQILNQLPAEERSRLVECVRVANPEAAVRIETIIVSHQVAAIEKARTSIEKITKLRDQDVQQLLREVPAQDVAISLKTATPEVAEKILRNVSESKQRQIETSFKELPPMPSSLVEAAQGRIMRKADEIYTEEAPAQTPRRLRSRLA